MGKKNKNFEPESSQRSYPLFPDGLERTRIGGSPLMPALSGQIVRLIKLLSVGPTINSCATS